MIVSVVSMPEGVVTRTGLPEARERLRASGLVIVTVEQEDDDPPCAEQPLSRLLGVEDEAWEWFGEPQDEVRAEYHGDFAACVVPVVHSGRRISYVQVLVDPRHLVIFHRGPVDAVGTFLERLAVDSPAESFVALFLFLQGVLETFRRAVTDSHLEVEDLEEAMFAERRPEQVRLLARQRRHAAQLHRAFLPYAALAQEVLVRRRMTSHGLSDERRALNSLHEHTVQLVLLEIESLRDAARRAAGSYASLIADQQNVVINRLTVVSMIFLPLSFLTGFFGMNFAFLTNRMESEDSFLWLGLGLQLLAVVMAMYYVLYRTHWRQLRVTHARDTLDDLDSLDSQS
ncbi:CorA family divalent cation transporter [Streptomyces sp. NPDC002265]|uniref:magnesium transporter CorA family protein n=1 Tax=Streptomyces sp. NPDC002265 TaxID=3154415 RepID=UPI00332A5539